MDFVRLKEKDILQGCLRKKDITQERVQLVQQIVQALALPTTDDQNKIKPYFEKQTRCTNGPH